MRGNGMTSHKPTLLFVYGSAGPSIDYILPRMNAHADIATVLLIDPPPAARERISQYSRVVERITDCTRLPFTAVVSRLADAAAACKADGIITMSEFAVELVGAAAGHLGLRSAGPNALRSRNKLMMRECWSKAGVPIPRFRGATDLNSLRLAISELRLPVLVKVANIAGSVGHTIVQHADDISRVFTNIHHAMRAAGNRNFGNYYLVDQVELIVEELIEATTDGWYGESGYGDYVSVEGIVVAGTYHPLAVSGRFPSIPTFTELGNHTPCPIPPDRLAVIERQARKAVDALELEDCATHTEMKLCKDGKICLIESAARFAGATVVPMIDTAYGLDLVGTLSRSLLGLPTELPSRMLTLDDAICAAANVPILATDSKGRPWSTSQRFWPDCDWSRLTSPGTIVRISEGQTIQSGTIVPAYDRALGALNYAGRFLMTATDAKVLKRDAMNLIDGMEGLLQDTASSKTTADSG
jgi:biotin carboxylase